MKPLRLAFSIFLWIIQITIFLAILYVYLYIEFPSSLILEIAIISWDLVIIYYVLKSYEKDLMDVK